MDEPLATLDAATSPRMGWRCHPPQATQDLWGDHE
jgi:hypothetical protein